MPGLIRTLLHRGIAVMAAGTPSQAQTLPLPPRPANAPDGRDFVARIHSLPIAEREKEIESAIQPLYFGHAATWVDYSQGIRLVSQSLMLNGETTTVARVLADPALSGLLSDEGVITEPRYTTNVIVIRAAATLSAVSEFKPGAGFGERVATFAADPEVRIQINEPAATDFSPGKPILLILYALPNGNTIEQTAGHQLKRGEDWHYDIQHIAAQTRFLRHTLTNRTIVVAYLEAASRSWPTWRGQHVDLAIPGVVRRVRDGFPPGQVELVLASHSGGGSFVFGWLNALERIPDDVARIAFLDSDYAYDTVRGHGAKLAAWLESSSSHALCVLAYNDAAALLDGKSFVSAPGGTWGRTRAMLRDLGANFAFGSGTNSSGQESYFALDGRVQILMKENPDHKILHTVQVERNGFMHAMLIGTPEQGKGYEYFGERAYRQYILPE